MIPYNNINTLKSGYFYVPYIPMYRSVPYSIMSREQKAEHRKNRKTHLMKCPSFPFSCTGHCLTEEFEEMVNQKLIKEFGEI